ncbi:hypothetical protein VKT23_004799 [Stygiomarasmius scandens]|uniref:Uncharacterized protein n=1 Tax=Marasmiellus scandens TaxID=2682957 RepID=A0ABR1JSU3_9AGAR
MSAGAPFVTSGVAKPPSLFIPEISLLPSAVSYQPPSQANVRPSSMHKPLNVNDLIKKTPVNSNGNPNGFSKTSCTPHHPNPIWTSFCF